MHRTRKQFWAVAFAFAVLTGPAIGSLAGETPEQRIALIAEHDRHVRAATEQAGKRYSVCLSGDQNLLPDWAAEPRIPLFELDAYYRDPAIGWPAPDRTDTAYGY